MNLINQFSYPLVILAALVLVFLFLRRLLQVRPVYVLTLQGLMLASALAFYLLLQPGSSSVDSVAQARQLIQNGRPTFLEFFSNYCGGCIVFQPLVSAIVEDFGDEFDFLSVDIHTDFGRDLRRQLGFSFTPEYVLFDAAGQEVWRDHLPPSSEALQLARSG